MITHEIDIYNTENKYKIIYADPPWNYKTWSKKGNKKSPEQHYNIMNINDIYNMSSTIQNISDKDSVLLLWVTFPLLQEGLNTIKEWGFIYKTCAFTWIKLNKKSGGLFTGLGHYTRANPELCLLATKGKPLKRVSKSVKNAVLFPISEHSRKPAIIRDYITDLFGDLPKIELFSREYAPKWDCWGNQTGLFNV